MQPSLCQRSASWSYIISALGSFFITCLITIQNNLLIKHARHQSLGHQRALTNQKVIKFQPLSPAIADKKNNKLLGQKQISSEIKLCFPALHHSAKGSDPFNYKTRQKQK